MVKIPDPTVAFSQVVTARRRSTAASTGERFLLGLHGLECGSIFPSAERAAVIGARGVGPQGRAGREVRRLLGAVATGVGQSEVGRIVLAAYLQGLDVVDVGRVGVNDEIE